MGFRSLAVAAVLAMMAACLVPSVSASADFGGLLEEREEETVVVSEEGESSGEDNNVLGELLSGDRPSLPLRTGGSASPFPRSKRLRLGPPSREKT